MHAWDFRVCSCKLNVLLWSGDQELGAACFHDLACADDAIGMEDVVDPWCKHILTKVKDVRRDSSSNDTEDNPGPQASSAIVNAASEPKKSAPTTAATKDNLPTTTEMVDGSDRAAAKLSASDAEADAPGAQRVKATGDASTVDTSDAKWTSSSAQQSLRALTLLGRGGTVHFNQHNLLTKATKTKKQTTPPKVTDRKSSPALSSPESATAAIEPEPKSFEAYSGESVQTTSNFGPVGLDKLFPDMFSDPYILEKMMKEVRAPRRRPEKHKFRARPDSSRLKNHRDSVQRLAKTRPVKTLPSGTLGATIVHAKELTNSSFDADPTHPADDFSARRVLLVRMKLHQSFTWSCGDAFGVYCENNTDEVEKLLTRLNVQRDLWDSEATEFKPKLPHIFPNTSIRTLLTFCCSLRWIFKKAFLRSLAEYCSDPFEKNQLLLLSSSTGRVYFDALILRQQPSILELLEIFPSCMPPVSVLLSHTTALMPRYYSVANSPLENGGRSPSKRDGDNRIIEVVFSVVRYSIGSPKYPVRRSGLCTTWLEDIVEPFFHKDQTFQSREITLIHRPGGDFRLPDDVERPVLMIGPGTGVAPFVGFLKHREIQRTVAEQITHDEVRLLF